MPKVHQTPDLPTLAERINNRERKSRTDQLAHARAQHDDLLAAKQQCGHGKWMKWCREHLSIGPTMVSYYLKFSVTEDMSEDEQWAEWQRIQGNSPKEKDGEAASSDAAAEQGPTTAEEPTRQPSRVGSSQGQRLRQTNRPGAFVIKLRGRACRTFKTMVRDLKERLNVKGDAKVIYRAVEELHRTITRERAEEMATAS